VQVWLSTGHTDMRKGFDGLALLVQETLKRNHTRPVKTTFPD
jgi:transposase